VSRDPRANVGQKLLRTIRHGASARYLKARLQNAIVTRPLTLNDELAVPNKLFEYLMAGLAVVAPRLPGVAPIIEAEQVGATFEPGSSVALAQVLSSLVNSPGLVSAMKQRARAVALSRFNAEAQRSVLLSAWTGD
jgi:glycosyltransferase involved in cell wall biosynthesis